MSKNKNNFQKILDYYRDADWKGIFLIIGLFILFDFLLHVAVDLLRSSGYMVDLFFPAHSYLPDYYYIGKLIFLTIAIPIIINVKRLNSAFKQCITLAILLQARYLIIAGYSIITDISMILIHYALLRLAFVLETKRPGSKLFKKIKNGRRKY